MLSNQREHLYIEIKKRKEKGGIVQLTALAGIFPKISNIPRPTNKTSRQIRLVFFFADFLVSELS